MRPLDKTPLALRLIKLVLGPAKGRPFAALLLLCLLTINVFSELTNEASKLATLSEQAMDFIGTPLHKTRTLLFDSYQQAFPRTPKSQPVTIVAIDEKSLRGVGQWPWPRDQLATLINQIQRYGPAGVGLDIYFPEPDQTSPSRIADRLPADQAALADALRTLPNHEALLAQALTDSPSVLGVVGFDFETYTTNKGVLSVPLATEGKDPQPYIQHYANVLTSMPELQAAAHGQALLSVEAQDGAVRHLPMVASIGDQLVPSLSLEMLRIGTGSEAIQVTTGDHGIASMQVADLSVPTQPDGEAWLYFAPLQTGLGRYVSAQDVLQGTVDPRLFAGKLVLIGLTGEGLNDMRTTALGEVVPGIEIQAQIIEALFDGDFLLRPWWMKWAETLVLVLLCSALIWLVPRSDSRLSTLLKSHPRSALSLLVLANLLIVGFGFALFHHYGLLFDAASFVIILTLVMGGLIASALIEGLGDARIKLARLIENGISLGRTHTREALLRQTLSFATEIASCQSATYYVKTKDERVHPSMCTSNTNLPTIEWHLSPSPTQSGTAPLISHAALAGETIIIDDFRIQSDFDAADLQRYSEIAAMDVVSSLVVPMKLNDELVVGLIQLNNATNPQTGDIIPFDPKVIGFIEALAAQAAVAIENLDLRDAQKALLDSTIQIIARAIDAKSAYTGGHCERVPELAMMLAQAACQIKEGPLADFAFNSEDEWREFRIGAWLHDCGKVTTPEYVVDKSTKLETIFNRIHEIRTRFEVLLRDAQIERLLAIHERGDDPAEAQARYEASKTELMDDFSFVAECNLGGEFMAPERIARLQRIAGRTWWRNFDDRLGLSHEELVRHEHTPAEPLPAREHLLTDKPHHLVERPPTDAFDDKYGFQLKVPEHLYNLGEVYNLSVGRGTLTDEERFKINEHIIQTIIMLEQLSLPEELSRIPEYAGTHHETLVGDGYPRKLTAKELSIPSRIMAIADIFEALTASDRPYKKAKTLSESIEILARFKQDQHIDPVLFELFLRSGVYKTYAEQYLRPEQIDQVDIERYLGR